MGKLLIKGGYHDVLPKTGESGAEKTHGAEREKTDGGIWHIHNGEGTNEGRIKRKDTPRLVGR